MDLTSHATASSAAPIKKRKAIEVFLPLHSPASRRAESGVLFFRQRVRRSPNTSEKGENVFYGST